MERWYTDAELTKLKELRAANKTIVQIANKLGWSRNAVCDVIKFEKITPKRRPNGQGKPRRKPKSESCGQKPKVLTSKAKGGTILLRLDVETHRKLAQYCVDNNVSINKQVLLLTQSFLESLQSDQ